MTKDQEYIKFLKLARVLFDKYNLNQVNFNIHTIHCENGREKDLLKIKIKNNHGFTLEDGYYDILLGDK